MRVSGGCMDKEVVSLWIGWASTVVLLATLLAQIWRQWKMGKADEVSPALFVGQCIASAGFIAYSAMLGNIVFVVSNVMILTIALIGEAVRRVLMRRAKQRKAR
jgi:MtN3 and saliva related transmembrane protein